jgi:restriction endonuclease S subunit
MNHIINTKILSTGFLGMETPFPNYLYALVSSEEFQYEKNINSSGTTMQSINNNILYNMLIQNCDESTLV